MSISPEVKTLKKLLDELVELLAVENSPYIFCVVGASGSGKTTQTEWLRDAIRKLFESRKIDADGLRCVESMTTRKPRFDGETGHVFLSKEEFDRYEMVAYTMFDGNEYGVPAEMLDERELYVIDIEGVKTLRERYHGKPIVVIYLDITPEEAARRMRERGDSEEKISKRLANDEVMFADLEGLAADYVIDANRSQREVTIDLCRIVLDTLKG